ncbi:urease accessory protein UreD [Psychrobacter arenosus]|uniref:urease accessory protein UreD n=1 Tax=Psychrobacter arenosus TaxID=256326 RepID=UPI001918F93F|nr:urease accessory protein UreD [Psychrobacter arenosus]
MAPDLATAFTSSPSGLSGWHSTLKLGFNALGTKTRLVKRQHCGALQVQRALYPEPNSPTAAHQAGICHGIILYPPAGIAAGDKLKIDIELASGSHAVLTTPGAGKWYGKEQDKSQLPDDNNEVKVQHCATDANFARQDIRAAVAEGACLEWLPQESIVFNHANIQARTQFELANSSRLLTWDIVVFGRQAYEEVFACGQYRNELTIRRNGKLSVYENSNHAAGSRWFTSPLAMAGQHIVGTFWAVPAIDTFASNRKTKLTQTIAILREQIATQSLPVVCSQTEQAICIRYLGDDVQACFAAFSTLRHVLRQEWWQLTEYKPRIWDT